MRNTEIMNSYVIFSDVLSIESSSLSAAIGGLSGSTNLAIVDRSYVVLPNDVSIGINIMSLVNFLSIGGIFGRDDEPLLQSSINNSYVIYRGDLMITTTQSKPEDKLFFTISSLGASSMPVENSYAFFEGNYFSVTPLATDVTPAILPSSARSVYFHTRTDTGNPNYHRTLPQLRCPTDPDATCDGATTYAGWDASIWNFGDANTLPTLRGIPSCPPGYPEDECRFGRSPE